MINKKNLWFITLTSIILAVSIYYIAIPGETLSMVSKYLNEDISVTSLESEELTTLRVMKEEEDSNTMQELQDTLLNEELTIAEKNEAYQKIKNLNNEKSLEEKIERILKDTYNISVFVSIKDDKAQIVLDNKEGNYELANNIINTVNKELNNTYYVTVKFE